MYRKLTCFIVLVLIIRVTGNASADLVGHWSLDEGSGMTAYDSSGNGFDGTLVGDTKWVAGKYGAAVEVDGNGDYVEIPPIGINSVTVTMSAWIKRNGIQSNYTGIFFTRNMPTNDLACGLNISPGGTNLGYTWNDNSQATWSWTSGLVIPDNEWCFVALVVEPTQATVYVNEEYAVNSIAHIAQEFSEPLWLGQCTYSADRFFDGQIDDGRVYDNALTEGEILGAMQGAEGYPYALSPNPVDGALHADTWASLSWRAGDFAVSHDVYFGENFDDVNDGIGDTFQSNQTLPYFVVGFPGYPYPDGLVPGTTYYWRIDEVNEADPNSPWRGNVWSFSIPPKTAYFPNPVDGAELVQLNAQLTWTAGYGARLHYIVFGEDFDEVSNAPMGVPNGTTAYNPGSLKLAKTYYWRVDEFDGVETHKGDVWSFTTLGAASNPNPANGAVDVKPSITLTWNAGSVAASHELYFGTDADTVRNATKTSPEYKGPKTLGEESYDTGKLEFNSTYYWRIEEVNDASTDSPWPGKVWSFTTGDFFVIDDFEDYDAGDNQIWYAWHDGLGYGAPGTDPYYAGNGTGAAVGDENSPSYTEETIVHGGAKSMPVSYDNNKQGYAYYSEVEHTLTDQRDWTERGVGSLSIWFRGRSDNGIEPLCVVISNSAGNPAVVIHDDPAAAQIDTWTEWVIPLSAFSDQGIDLTNVDSIAIGLGTQGNTTVPGGSGKMYIDDIRLQLR